MAIQESARYRVAIVAGIDPETLASGDVFYAPSSATEAYSLEATACGLVCVAPSTKWMGDAGVVLDPSKPMDSIHKALDNLSKLKKRAEERSRKIGWDVSIGVLETTMFALCGGRH